MYWAVYGRQCYSQPAISISDCIICHLLRVSIHHPLNHPLPRSLSLSRCFCHHLSLFTSLSNYRTQTNISPRGPIAAGLSCLSVGWGWGVGTIHTCNLSKLERNLGGIKSKSFLSGESIAARDEQWRQPNHRECFCLSGSLLKFNAFSLFVQFKAFKTQKIFKTENFSTIQRQQNNRCLSVGLKMTNVPAPHVHRMTQSGKSRTSSHALWLVNKPRLCFHTAHKTTPWTSTTLWRGIGQRSTRQMSAWMWWAWTGSQLWQRGYMQQAAVHEPWQRSDHTGGWPNTWWPHIVDFLSFVSCHIWARCSFTHDHLEGFHLW